MKSVKRAKREARQLFHLCHVNDLLDASRIREIVQHLVAANRRNCPAILTQFLRLVRLDLAEHAAQIESAAPLPADLQADIQASLHCRYGRGLTITFTLRPSLIGGVRIQVGSDVYDGSVLAGLKALDKSF
jgi:F-type H+-transporting ATPase subunit delta